MRQPFGSVLPEIDPGDQDRRRRPSRRWPSKRWPSRRRPSRRRPRAPAVERIAGWSVRHRKTAVFGWLLMVAAVFAVSQLMGSRNLPSFDPGQAGQAERALQRADPAYFGSGSESVLIQARTPGETFSRSASMQQAARQVVTSLSAVPKGAHDIRSPLSPGNGSLVSADGRSALVTFQVLRPCRTRTR